MLFLAKKSHEDFSSWVLSGSWALRNPRQQFSQGNLLTNSEGLLMSLPFLTEQPGYVIAYLKICTVGSHDNVATSSTVGKAVARWVGPGFEAKRCWSQFYSSLRTSYSSCCALCLRFVAHMYHFQPQLRVFWTHFFPHHTHKLSMVHCVDMNCIGQWRILFISQWLWHKRNKQWWQMSKQEKETEIPRYVDSFILHFTTVRAFVVSLYGHHFSLSFASNSFVTKKTRN